HVTHVHVAIATAGETARAPHVLRENFSRLHTANEKEREVAMGRAEDVVLLGSQSRTHRDGLLSAADVDAAHNLALAVELALDAIFHLAHEGHVAEEAA